MLWQLQYALLFGKADNCCENKDKFGQHASDQADEFSCKKKEGVGPVMDVDWREAFKRTYIGTCFYITQKDYGHDSWGVDFSFLYLFDDDDDDDDNDDNYHINDFLWRWLT